MKMDINLFSSRNMRFSKMLYFEIDFDFLKGIDVFGFKVKFDFFIKKNDWNCCYIIEEFFFVFMKVILKLILFELSSRNVC